MARVEQFEQIGREHAQETTNLPFGEWTKVFADARLAKSVVDRLTHKAHIVETGTESWRFRHGLEKRGAKKKGD